MFWRRPYLYVCFHDVSNGKCSSYETYLVPSGTQAEYTMRMGKQSAILKVVYMDEENLLLYACSERIGNDMCARSGVTVSGLSRSADGAVSSHAMASGMRLCAKMCLQPGDFVTSSSTGSSVCYKRACSYDTSFVPLKRIHVRAFMYWVFSLKCFTTCPIF